MHDIKFIKENPDLFDKNLKLRNFPPHSKKILELYNKYLSFLNETQSLQQEKNTLSKSFSSNLDKSDIKNIKDKVSNIKEKLDKLKQCKVISKHELNDILLSIPNLVDTKTPIGKSELENKTLREEQYKKKNNFKLKNHVEISEEFDFLDYEKAIKLSGSRFSVIKSDLALLSRALMNFMLDVNTNDFGYKECIVPELVKSNCLVGTGQLPKFGDDLFKTHFNDLWLIPTAEVPLTNFHREEVINADLLPLRYTSFTNCFRAEAGAAGKDTKGLMREHQFGKVELVSITEPDSSSKELERMIECVETILKKIEIPYRLVELCSGDLGFSSSYTIDFEVWMPGQNKFREVSSCSNCKDFQSRRMKMRSKKKDSGEVFYPHTLNGSSLAIGRILIGILENFQEKDGSISIPKCIRKYMNNKKIINNNE